MIEPVPKQKAKRIHKNTPKTRAAKIKYQALHADPVKVSARDKVRHAINRGDLVPPKECQECAAIPVTADGRRGIQAHHHNGYSNPLDVEWLCVPCHSLRHRNENWPAVEQAGAVNGEASCQ